jgi:hypothetical protein
MDNVAALFLNGHRKMNKYWSCMFLRFLVKLKATLDKQGGITMEKESTHDFVEKLRDTKKKDELNKKRQGSGDPEKKLPNKQH